jgi:hypothetical protein
MDTFRRAVLRLVALAVVVAGMVVLPAATAGAAAAAPGSFVTMHTLGTSWNGRVSSEVWPVGEQAIAVRGDIASKVVVEIRGTEDNLPYDITLSAGAGRTLEVGTYEAPQGATVPDAPSVSISDSDADIAGTLCNGPWAGTFTVRDVSPDLSRLWVTYDFTCGIYTTASGEIRIGQPAGELVVASEDIAYPEWYPGRYYGIDRRIALINAGAAAVNVTDIAVTDGTADFRMLPFDEWPDAPCRTIPVGGSCEFTVGFTPSVAGPRTGAVTITDSTTAGTHAVRLSGHGIPGHTSWATHSQVDDTADDIGDRAVGTDGIRMIRVVGDAQKVTLHLEDHRNGTYEAEFRGSAGAPLLPGTTHTDGLLVTGYGHCYSPTGRFTVLEAEYDAQGAPTKLSVTFEQHCEGRVAGLFGSIAWRADNPAPPAGGIVGVVPDAVLSFAAKPARDSVALSWYDIGTADWAETIVRGAEGMKAPATPTSGFAVYRGKAGKATATGLRPGVAYSFAAFSEDTEGLVSPRRTVTVHGSKLTLSASTPKVVYGKWFKLRGMLTDAGTGRPIAGVRVRVEAVHVPSGTVFLIGRPTTSDTGVFSVGFNPAANFRYRVSYPGGGTHLGAAKAGPSVAVAAFVDIATDRSYAQTGTKFRVATAVWPADPGGVARLQRLVGGVWKTVARQQLNADKATVFTVTAGAPATAKYRVTTPGDGYRVAGASKVVRVHFYR